jgi:hypothetical protein
MKQVQLFVLGQPVCEVDAYLVDYMIRGDCIELKTKEEGGKRCDYIFPLHNVAMVRIFDGKQD